MKKEQLVNILQQVAEGSLAPTLAFEQLQEFADQGLPYAKLDYQRELRRGFPEVVYAQGKTAEQVLGILKALAEKSKSNILATRCSRQLWQEIAADLPEAQYYEEAQLICIEQQKPQNEGLVAVLCAGTSDLQIAEEAALTAYFMGNKVQRFYDVGVAGIHRLLGICDQLKKARVLVVVAGMEGALPSVVAGLLDKPVIAVPTSVGYGASFQGVAALLGMLNSCSSGVTVVNIDNGFGAGYAASLINKVALK